MATDRKPGNTTDDRAVTPGRQGFASIPRDDQHEETEETGGAVPETSETDLAFGAGATQVADELAAHEVNEPAARELDELDARRRTGQGRGRETNEEVAAREVNEPAPREVTTEQGTIVDDDEKVSLMGRADDYGQGLVDGLSAAESDPSADTSARASRIEILPEEADQRREQQAIERDDADGSTDTDDEDDRSDRISLMSRSDDYGQGVLSAARDEADRDAMDPPPLGVAGASIEDQLEVLEDDQGTADLPLQE